MNLNRLKRQLFSRVYLTRVLFILIILGLCLCLLFFLFRFAGRILHYTTGALPQTSGRTNIVLLGVGGSGHDGPELTDSIVFVSFTSATGQATLISLPRDIWVPSLKAKINTAFAYGQQRDPRTGGLVLAKSSISEIINQPVHLAFVIDFSTFQTAIDLLGGVDVNVATSFTDSHYPLLGRENDACSGDPDYACRYETISFTAGPHHFDGQTALKYVRSRYASGGEGTDFARGRRQEKVLAALKTKLVSWSTLRHPGVYLQLYRLLAADLITDLKPDQYFSLLQLALKSRRLPFNTYSLSQPDQLYNPPLSDRYDNQWILLPKDNQPQIVFDYVKGLLN